MVVNLFLVSTQANGKQRLIVDLRHLNQYLTTEKLKLDDMQAALPALRQSKCMFSFDLTKAYNHMDLDESMQRYFGFSFSYLGQTYYGYYTICPFGLSTLPREFTKLMCPLVAKWREMGFHLFLYLDDFLAACTLKEEAEFFTPIIRADLAEVGVFEQFLKCNWGTLVRHTHQSFSKGFGDPR